jgi:hypothetical protein
VAQVHVRDGVDGLAPPGTVGAGVPTAGVRGPGVPKAGGRVTAGGAEGGDAPVADPGVIGMAFKWNPDRALYLADAARDRLVVLHLGDDGHHFTLEGTGEIRSPALKRPVDVAAAVPEIANPRFSSHTSLAGGSDLYVANRGDGSLLRLDQQGRLLARATVEVPGLGPLGADRIRSLAVSADAQRIWLGVEGELPGFAGQPGALLEVEAFDAAGPLSQGHDPTAAGEPAPASRPARQAPIGGEPFLRDFGPEEGLGPHFNASSCAGCHPGPGGQSMDERDFVRRVARMDPVSGRVTYLDGTSAADGSNSLVTRRFSSGGGGPGTAEEPLPAAANVTSLRMPPALFEVARLDEIPDAVIEAQAVPKGDGIRGRVHRVTSATGERRVGRFGWKAQVATLEEMAAEALGTELGIESALAPPRAGPSGPVEDDGRLARALADFLRGLDPAVRGDR